MTPYPVSDRRRDSRRAARRLAAAAVGVVLALGVAGCGSDHADVTGTASRQLSTDVTRLQAAAGTRDGAAIDRAAGVLRAHVAAQQKAGLLSRSRAAAILAQLTNVLADTSVTVRATMPSPAAKAPPGPPEEHQGKGRGKKADEGGDGGD